MLLNDDTVVIGSPGSYNWKGNVFMVSVSDDFLHRDKTCYYSPVRDNEVSPVDSHSYLGNYFFVKHLNNISIKIYVLIILFNFLGMSTTADYFFGKPNMAYAAGAPRANGTGQVVLFTKLRPSVNLMDARLIISGEQFASSFGYELATADLNGDKYVVVLIIFYLTFN